MFSIYINIYIYIVWFDRFCQIPFEHGTALWDDPWQHSFCKCKTDIRIHSQHMGLKFTTSYISISSMKHRPVQKIWLMILGGSKKLGITTLRWLTGESCYEKAVLAKTSPGLMWRTEYYEKLQAFLKALDRQERSESNPKKQSVFFWLSCWETMCHVEERYVEECLFGRCGGLLSATKFRICSSLMSPQWKR